MPRWLLALLIASLVVLVAVATRPILFPAGNPRLTPENFDRIREGMKLADVEAIIRPPGDYRTIPTEPVYATIGTAYVGGGQDYEALQWIGNEAVLVVNVFLHSREVRDSGYEPIKPDPVGLFDLLRWRWNRWRESRR
jgi:hypothetical protein